MYQLNCSNVCCLCDVLYHSAVSAIKIAFGNTFAVADRVQLAPGLKAGFVQEPLREFGAGRVRFGGASALQAAHNGPEVVARGALMPRAAPDRRIQPDDPRADDVHAVRPDYALLVRPHLVRRVADLRHSVEDVRRSGGWCFRCGFTGCGIDHLPLLLRRRLKRTNTFG